LCSDFFFFLRASDGITHPGKRARLRGRARPWPLFNSCADETGAPAGARRVPEDPPKPAIWSGRAAADGQSNEGAADPEGRLFVLLLDDALIPPDPRMLKNARDVAKHFIDKVTPADRVAVVFSQSGRNQNFTNDRR